MPKALDSDARQVIAAAAAGDVAALRRLLERNPNLFRPTEHGDPVHVAVREGHIEAVRVLLGAGSVPDAIHGRDTLITIARDRDYEEIARLLEEARDRRGRIAPSDTQADHPIHIAAEGGNLARVLEWLDTNPALVHHSDRSGGTPLHRAVIGRSRAVVTLLLDRGAEIHALHGSGLGSSAGYAPQDQQPIDLALWSGPRQVRPSLWWMVVACAGWAWKRWRGTARAERGDVETSRLLLSRGAVHDLPVAAALGDIDRVIAILDANPARIREARPNGRLALSAAVEFGHDDIVRLLLERGAEPTWPDADAPRGAALHAAARMGNRPIVELLLSRGADPNGHVDAAGNAVFAAKTPEIRRLLIAHGGDLDPFDLVWLNEDDEVMRRVTADPASADAGCGGVFTAVITRGKRDLLVRLLEAGIRVPPVVDGCHSYLFERPDLLPLLLGSGMSPDLPTPNGRTPLHDLCDRDNRNRTMSHRTKVAAILLDAGATISARDEEYCSTPLAWAARNNLPDMVAFLLARGAPTNLPDDKRWATPLAWATKRGHRRIAEMLRKAGATA